jgi:hypothetical protein
MGLYRIYIDEVGNHDLVHADDPNERYLSLTGVIMESGHTLHIVQPEMDQMKRDFFQQDPDRPIVLHRKDIVNKRGDFVTLRDLQVETRFNNTLLEMLARWEYSVITVVIDKKAHREKYKVWQYHPYHYCLAVLLERFIRFLQSGEHRGDVMAEARGGVEDRKLMASHTQLHDEGNDNLDAGLWQTHLTSRELKVKPKTANIAGLQIADLLAHPSRREILREKKLVTDQRDTFGDQISQILRQQKYRRSPSGAIWGYGKKLLP